MRWAAKLTRDAIKGGRLWEGEAADLTSEGQRLMSFTFNAARGSTTRPTWRNLRSEIRPITCRRALMYRPSMLMTVTQCEFHPKPIGSETKLPPVRFSS